MAPPAFREGSDRLCHFPTGSRRNPATCGTNQVAEIRRFAPTLLVARGAGTEFFSRKDSTLTESCSTSPSWLQHSSSGLESLVQEMEHGKIRWRRTRSDGGVSVRRRLDHPVICSRLIEKKKGELRVEQHPVQRRVSRAREAHRGVPRRTAEGGRSR